MIPRPASGWGKHNGKTVAGSGQQPPPAHPEPYAPRVDLTLIEAWALWWSGQQLTDHTLYGVSVLWLARAGKLLAFLAGTTIVLDALGSERLLEWGDRLKGMSRVPRLVTIAFVYAAVLAWIAVARPTEVGLEFPARAWSFLIFAGLALVAVFAQEVFWLLVRLLGWVLARPRFEKWVRIVAVPLFFLGFALDYMAS